MTLNWWLLIIPDTQPDPWGSELCSKHVNNYIFVKGNLPSVTMAVGDDGRRPPGLLTFLWSQQASQLWRPIQNLPPCPYRSLPKPFKRCQWSWRQHPCTGWELQSPNIPGCRAPGSLSPCPGPQCQPAGCWQGQLPWAAAAPAGLVQLLSPCWLPTGSVYLGREGGAAHTHPLQPLGAALFGAIS